MFVNILMILLGLLFGLGLIFKTEAFGFLSWAIRHNVDESGKKQQLIALKFYGVIIIGFCIVAIFQFVV
ncbi:hypothetical protein OAO42_01915 [Candidatus Izimaplasma bacterium]|nr:hypothetical protein [Candidatus Izimaplasma bacterium]